MVGNIIGVEWYYEGVGRKSRCIEFDLVSSTERVNAVLYPCGGRTAVYFFGSIAGVVLDFSSVLVAQALAFKAEGMSFLQSWAT